MIPPALARKLRNPLLEAHQFTATQFDSRDDKAWFGNHFLKFLASDCPFNLFSQRFYRRLSQTFGQIAYYDRFGFYGTFFEATQGRIEFLEQCLQWPCYGDPGHTYSDVERALQARMTASEILDFFKSQLAIETRRSELANLERLKTKYEPGQTAPTLNTAAHKPVNYQGDLFAQS